jgi:hypothetical protein
MRVEGKLFSDIIKVSCNKAPGLVLLHVKSSLRQR